MSLNFWSPISLNGYELRNAKIQNLASAPTSATGLVYFDTTLNAFYGYNGTSWVSFGGGGGGGLSGSGTINYLPKFSASTTLANSSISDTGSLVTISNQLSISNDSTFYGDITLIPNSNYISLVHFEGTNASRNITDLVGNTWTMNQYTSLSTTYMKFGLSSISFNGTSSILRCTNPSSSLFFGTGNFTIDFWAYFNSVSTTQTLIDIGGSTLGLQLNYITGTGWTVVIAGTTYSFAGTTTATTWHHIALTRSSGSIMLFVDGTQVGSTTTAASSIAGSSYLIYVGATNPQGTTASTNFFNGYLDELRILNIAAWTSSFTVPSIMYDYATLIINTIKTTAGYVAVSDGDGNVAFKQPPKSAMPNFGLAENVSNTTAYFYTGRTLGSTQDNAQRSGNSSGMSYANSCSPWGPSSFNGRITKAVLSLASAGVNNGSVTYPCLYNVSIYRVGFSAAQDPNVNGGSANTIQFPLWSGVGLYSVSTVSVKVELDNLNIPINVGDMLAVQFVNGSGASNVAMSQMAFITLTIEEVG